VNAVQLAIHRRGQYRLAEQSHKDELADINKTHSPVQTQGLVYRPATTAYNYGRPPIISQSGQFSSKFHAFRRLLLEHRLVSRLQTVPANPITMAIGVIRLEHQLTWQNLLKLIPDSPTHLESPVFMELLNTATGSGQHHGWIVYRTRLPLGGSHLSVSGIMRDRVQVFINGRHISTVYNNRALPFNLLANIPAFNKSTSADSVLELIVENMGRSSFGLLSNQRKGFQGSVSVDGKKVEANWEHFSIDFSMAFLTAVRQCRDWIPTVRPSASSQGQPTLFRGQFNVKQLKDTYIDMSEWTKGVVIINGFVLGRYWNIGPQQSLYVPSPILTHGVNEVLVFELERTLKAEVNFVSKPPR